MNKKDGLVSRLVKQSWPWMLLSISLGFSGAVFNGVGMTLVIPVVISFLGLNTLTSESLPPILRSVFAIFDSVPEQYRAIAMISAVFLMIILKGLSNYGNSIVSGVLNRRVATRLRQDGFRLLLDVDLQYISEMRLGDIMNYISGEVLRVASTVGSLVSMSIAGVTILVFLTILLLISWKLTIIATLILGLVAFGNQSFLKYAKSAGQDLSDASAALSIHQVEVLSGIRQVKSVANENTEFEYTKQLIKNRENASFRSQIVFAATGPVNEVSSVISIVLLVIIGRFLFAGELEVFSSIILTYLFVLTRMLPSVNQLYSARNQMANVSPSVKIIEYFLDRKSKPIMKSGAQPFHGLKSEIKFNSIWFQYTQSNRWNLQDISVTLPKGQTLALVGSSGAGKSTMADLLARFYDPNKGSIEIDGIDLREFDLQQYRRKIGIVSQDTFLFNASVRDNIKYGYPDATDEAVFQAAKLANAADFIQSLPQGFDTLIGDRGVMLSGGQRQRLAIARALLQNPEILILDEATSALDTVSERLVQQALENLSQDRTTLVIAHRLSTVQKADQIVVLEKGQIIESGTHEGLLAQNGHYANLYSIQFADNAEPEQAGKKPYRSSEFVQDSLSQTSYEIRSQLNGMLGLMELFNYELEEANEEQKEFITRTYQASLNILQSLEKLEEKVLPKR